MKLQYVLEWINDFMESGEKLGVFAYHQEMQYGLLDGLKKYSPMSILGGMTPKQKQAAVDLFQGDDSCRLGVLSMGGTGGGGAREGITLTAASNCVFTEINWNPGSHNQCEDRFHRIGTRSAVTCYYLVCVDTIEEKVAALVDAKRTVVAAVHGDIHQVADDRGILESMDEKFLEDFVDEVVE